MKLNENLIYIEGEVIPDVPRLLLHREEIFDKSKKPEALQKIAEALELNDYHLNGYISNYNKIIQGLAGGDLKRHESKLAQAEAAYKDHNTDINIRAEAAYNELQDKYRDIPVDYESIKQQKAHIINVIQNRLPAEFRELMDVTQIPIAYTNRKEGTTAISNFKPDAKYGPELATYQSGGMALVYSNPEGRLKLFTSGSGYTKANPTSSIIYTSEARDPIELLAHEIGHNAFNLMNQEEREYAQKILERDVGLLDARYNTDRVERMNSYVLEFEEQAKNNNPERYNNFLRNLRSEEVEVGGFYDDNIRAEYLERFSKIVKDAYYKFGPESWMYDPEKKYPPSQRLDECMAIMAEMQHVVAKDDLGMLEAIIPQTYKFYNEVALPKVRDYIEQLRQQEKPNLNKPVEGNQNLVITGFTPKKVLEKGVSV